MAKLDLTKDNLFPVFVGRMAQAVRKRQTAAQKGGVYDCMNTYGDGSHCVVGSGLPDGFIQLRDEIPYLDALGGKSRPTNMDVGALQRHNLLSIPEEYRKDVQRIQGMHDAACVRCEVRNKRNRKRMAAKLRYLVRKVKRDYGIDELPTEYPAEIAGIRCVD